MEFSMSPYPRRLPLSLFFAMLVSFIFILHSRAQQTAARISGKVKDTADTNSKCNENWFDDL